MFCLRTVPAIQRLNTTVLSAQVQHESCYFKCAVCNTELKKTHEKQFCFIFIAKVILTSEFQFLNVIICISFYFMHSGPFNFSSVFYPERKKVTEKKNPTCISVQEFSMLTATFADK